MGTGLGMGGGARADGLGRLAAAAVLAVALAACSRGEPRLMNIAANTATPDEFAILPTRPLMMPEDLASLPAPTPGEASRTDPAPVADAIRTLGGNPAVAAAAVPAGDAVVIAHARRFGADPAIRATLAAEDLEFRRRHDGRLLERWFNVNVYYRAYRRMALDRYAELARWRRAGIRTPAVPPDPAAR